MGVGELVIDQGKLMLDKSPRPFVLRLTFMTSREERDNKSVSGDKNQSKPQNSECDSSETGQDLI
jgi:hypothetical protein